MPYDAWRPIASGTSYRCQHRSAAPEQLVARVPSSQAGAGWDKCALCAYARSYADARSGGQSSTSWLEPCSDGNRAPATSCLNLAESQAGPGRERHNAARAPTGEREAVDRGPSACHAEPARFQQNPDLRQAALTSQFAKIVQYGEPIAPQFSHVSQGRHVKAERHLGDTPGCCVDDTRLGR